MTGNILRRRIRGFGTLPPRIVISSSSCKGVFNSMDNLAHVYTSL